VAPIEYAHNEIPQHLISFVHQQNSVVE